MNAENAAAGFAARGRIEANWMKFVNFSRILLRFPWFHSPVRLISLRNWCTIIPDEYLTV